MPPKPKHSKEEIVEAAFELARERGIDAVTAREVGNRLGSSVAPIFTVCNNMEELREEVRKLAKQRYQEYMADIFDYSPAFKEFGMRWVRFASEEPNLYRLLFLTKQSDESSYTHFRKEFESILTPLIGEIMRTFGLSEKDAVDLFDRMAVFANGLAAFVITDSESFSEERVSQSISQVCISLVITYKLRDETLDLPTANNMAKVAISSNLPQKKTKET